MLARRSEKRPFTAAELRFFENLVQQATAAINNARLFEEIHRNLEELSVLYEASSIVSANWNTQEVLNTLAQKMVVVIDAQQGYIMGWDKTEDEGVVKAAFINGANPAALRPLEIGQTFSLTPRALLRTTLKEQRAVLFAVDNPALEATERANLVAQGAAVRLVLPLVVRGETIGWTEVLGTEEELFTAEKIRLMRLLSNQAAVALENAQYLQQMEQVYQAELRRRRQAETLREISSIVGSSLQLNEVLERILDQLQRVVKYDSAAVHLVEGNRRRIIAGHGFAHPEEVIGLTFPLQPNEDEPGSLVIHYREPIVIGNISDQYAAFKRPPHDHIKSWLGTPLIVRDKVIGLITIDREVAHAFSQEDMNLAQAFANQVAIALENDRLYEWEINEIERELTIAHEIQETLLPQFAPQIPGLQISGRMTPVHQIGGDFFYFFDPAAGQFGVAIGDVSGKGIPAALYMAAVMTAIDTEINHKNPNPGQLLKNLHHILYERLRQKVPGRAVLPRRQPGPRVDRRAAEDQMPAARRARLARAGTARG
jgi:GAF domain-containing protein